jgi:uncharacterized protein (DUF2147 family)
MCIKFLFIIFSLSLFTGSKQPAIIASPAEQICGKWESSEKNLIVQVYCEDSKFKAKIIWFVNTGGKSFDNWTDVNNPDQSLRSRKILGMSVLNDLCYKSCSNSWEDGTIYDAQHGRDWNASAYIDKNGLLKVKGYWHFKFIGKTMTFNRI